MESSTNLRETFACHICTKLLSSKQNLKQHMNIHTGRRPFKCDHPGCEVSYKHASQLSNHKIIHSPQRVKISYPFDDFKVFIKLVLQALKIDSVSSVKIPEGLFKREEISLPPILNSQIGLELPKFNF